VSCDGLLEGKERIFRIITGIVVFSQEIIVVVARCLVYYLLSVILCELSRHIEYLTFQTERYYHFIER